MNAQLNHAIETIINTLYLKEQLEQMESRLKQDTRVLTSTDIQNISDYYKEEINGIYDFLIKNWHMKEASSVHEKCETIYRVWSDLRSNPITAKYPEFTEKLEFVNILQKQYTNCLNEHLVNNNAIQNTAIMLIDILNENNKYTLADYSKMEFEKKKTENPINDELMKNENQLVRLIALAHPNLESYLFIFNKNAPEVSNLDELKELNMPYVSIHKGIIGNFKMPWFAEYKTELPNELREFILSNEPEIPYKQNEKTSSNLAMFLAIYLNVQDKEDTFFKKENYNTNEIKETYKSLTKFAKQ